MFAYVVRTEHDNDKLNTFAYPITKSEEDPQAFLKYYDVFSKEKYQKNIIGKKSNLEEFINSFSFYSITFYSSNEDNVPIYFLRTNQCDVPNIYEFYKNVYNEDGEDNVKNWKPSLFHHISVPPRSRLYLFQYSDYKGKVLSFDNPSNAHNVYELTISVDDDIRSFKWYTMYPVKDEYVIDKNIKLYRPEQIKDSYNLHDEMKSYDPDLNLPVFKMKADPYHKTLINKWFDL